MDNLSDFIGSQFIGYDIKECVVNGDGEDYIQDSVFVEFKTSNGSFVMKSYNEHNGYYGGINMETQKFDDTKVYVSNKFYSKLCGLIFP